MRPAMLLFVILSLASRSNAMTLEVGEKTIEVPVTFSFVGSAQCLNSSHCGNTKGSDFWTLGAIAAAYEDINNMPGLNYFHNMTISFFDLINTGKRSIESTVDAASVPNSLGIIGLPDTCLDEATIAGVHDKVAVSEGCHFNLASYGDFDKVFVQLANSPSAYAMGVRAFVQRYGWTHVVVLSPSEGMETYFVKSRDQLIVELRTAGIRIVADVRLPAIEPEQDPTAAIADYARTIANTYLSTRIYVIFDPNHNAPMLRWTLSVMGRMGLLQTGEYFVTAAISEDGNRQWIDLSDRNAALRFGSSNTSNAAYQPTDNELMSYYRSLVVLADSAPPAWTSTKWQQFQDRITAMYEDPPCPPLCNYWTAGRRTPNKYWGNTGRLYDSLLLLAEAGQEMIMKGADITSGLVYFEYMIERVYKGISGTTEQINGDGLVTGTLQLMYFYNSPIRGGYSLWPFGYAGYINGSTANWGIGYYPTDMQSFDWVGGVAPSGYPVCGFEGELCVSLKDRLILIVSCVSAVVLLILIVITLLLVKQYRYERKLQSVDWQIERREVILQRSVNANMLSMKSMASRVGSMMGSSRGGGGNQFQQSMQQLRGNNYGLSEEEKNQLNMRSKKKNALDAPDDNMWNEIRDFGMGSYTGNMAALKRVWKEHVELTREVRKEILNLSEISQENIVEFKGIILEHPHVFIVTELYPRGSLRDVLENEDFQLDTVFLASMANDVAKGMDFLHHSRIGSHGRLKSSNCIVDARWVIRLSSFGLHQFRDNETPNTEGIQEGRELLWTSPELLRAQMNLALASVIWIQKSDIYSYAILLYEIFGRAGPWGDEVTDPKDIAERVKNPKDPRKPFRPDMKTIADAPKIIKETVAASWAEAPEQRPNFAQIRRKLRPITKGIKKTVVENMVKMMEKYTSKLEGVIELRSHELDLERKKSEKLLKMMLPESVADSLRVGINVDAEAFKCVTVYFSDIVGFVQLSTESTPIQIVTLLNDLYTCFDAIIEMYDVYKVETIGDAYMVVAGLPILNGPHHAGEIGSMSLALLDATQTFKIRHRPGDILQLRIGVHSGPCVAGVVGLRMPRYCLFGDTVNTASRMESNGEALKIHSSGEFKAVLDEIGGYTAVERGYIAMKGKGEQLTYWLVSEDKKYRRERIIRERKRWKTLEKTTYEPEDGELVEEFEVEQMTVQPRQLQSIIQQKK